MQVDELIESPLNYTGGKYKLLPQILPFFPNNTTRFVDIFCGGCNVGANVKSESVLFNDNNRIIIELFKLFKIKECNTTIRRIERIIKKYGLSDSSKHGYEFYSCSSSDGLATFNKDKFMRLREDFNNRTKKDERYYYLFYVLVVYAFNNQIRFNSKGEFNLPVGKRDFNSCMKEKLVKFINYLKTTNVSFSAKDFRKIVLNPDTDFVYADPPYLITCATYNENGGWGEKEEVALLEYLDKAHVQGIKFALSNVLSSKGKVNKILLDWIESNDDKYRVIHLNYSYSNSNYHTKDKKTKSDEVLVVNY
ncbi:MAG: DNA adenine methylase [Bacilli bacterium]|nr:DNA adenine methylase [Bacilli bacterium]